MSIPGPLHGGNSRFPPVGPPPKSLKSLRRARAPPCCPCAACRRRSEPSRRSATSASTAAQARSTRSSGRTGPGSRHCSGSRAASSTRTRGRSRSEDGARRRGSPAEARKLGLGMAYQTYSHVLDLSVAENLYLAAPADEQAEVRAMEEWAAAKLEDFEPRRPGDGARGLAVARRAAAARGRQGAARQAEGAPARRADDGARAGGRRAAPCARLRAEPGRGRRRLRQPSAAGGARHRRPHHGPPRRRLPGDVRRGRDVGGKPRRAHDRAAAPARVPGAARPRSGPREVLLAVSGLRGERFGPIDLDVAKGEILGIAGAEGNGQVPFLRGARRRRARSRQRRLHRQRARHAARRSARFGRASCC